MYCCNVQIADTMADTSEDDIITDITRKKVTHSGTSGTESVYPSIAI